MRKSQPPLMYVQQKIVDTRSSAAAPQPLHIHGHSYLAGSSQGSSTVKVGPHSGMAGVAAGRIIRPPTKTKLATMMKQVSSANL